VLELLSARGALFSQELKTLSQLLPAHLDEALRELAASGLITCDGFAAVRAFVSERKSGSARHRRSGMTSGMSVPAGRWSRFPGELGPAVEQAERLERWCRLLLRRYGVIFRDLLAREACAPAWQELVPILRRLELRGEIRGGRFVSGVAGEQFAAENAVEQLRESREEPAVDSWVLISAADPLNLSGIIDSGPRIPANHKNALIVRNGRFVAAKQAGQIDFFAEFPVEQTAEMRRALQTGRKEQATHVRMEWLDTQPIASRPRSLSDAPSRTIRRP
jgi:ATP-dependent Lhr-like helicase